MSNKSEVTISFLICTIKREKDLCRSISAICKADNCGISFEVIVVDQGQSAAAAEVCNEFNSLYISSESRGLSRARNIGLKECRANLSP